MRAIAAHLIHKAGFTHKTARTGAVTQVQRFGSVLNLNVHWRKLFLNGVYTKRADGSLRFHQVAAPTGEELAQLVHRLAQRIGRHLERQGPLQRDVENDSLTEDAFEADGLAPLHSASITYRIALGPQQGRKVFTLQTLPASEDDLPDTVAKEAGFSLHAGVAARGYERDKVERLCRYVSRPPVAESRLSLKTNGDIRYRLKTPYRDGTTHVILQPLDFLARLAALVPRQRFNLTRHYGVFAPNSRFRARVAPAGRGKGSTAAGGTPTVAANDNEDGATSAQRMTWAQRLRRVFRIYVDICPKCGGAMKIMPKALAALAGQALVCIDEDRGDREDPGARRCEGSATGGRHAPAAPCASAARDRRLAVGPPKPRFTFRHFRNGLAGLSVSFLGG